MAMYLLVMVVSALMLLFFVCSCKTTEYVEVPVVHTEYVYKESKDTAYVRDSVYIKEVQNGSRSTATAIGFVISPPPTLLFEWIVWQFRTRWKWSR